MRVGTGYDVHRLVEGRDLILGGVKIPFEKGLDGHSDADVIVHARYRKKGYGRQGLKLLCRAAKERGVSVLYDNMAVDNPALPLFLQEGFCEEERTDELIWLKKQLTD